MVRMVQAWCKAFVLCFQVGDTMRTIATMFLLLL
jgi:hypothetical protein